MINNGMMKEAVYSLNNAMKQVGREVNAEAIASIVQTHALATAASAAASGVIPGAGGAIALGIACTSTVTMYGRLAKELGIRLNNGLIRAVASAVVADLAAAVVASVAAAAAVSFIPGVGSMASSVLTAITNYGFVYLAGLIFIKLVASFGVSRMESMSEEEMKAAARKIQDDIDVKSAMKEAKASYKANKNQ